MLGEEINVPATVLDYFNHSSYKAQFLLRTAFHQNYSISGSKEFLLSNGSLAQQDFLFHLISIQK